MSKFADTVKQDTPRLVVMHKREGRVDKFQWGIVGGMPLLGLVGYLVRVQAELAFRQPEPCDQQAMVVAWDEEKQQFDWFVHPDIPVDALVGMIEAVKTTIVNTQMARQAAAQQISLLGPDGQPMRR